MTFSLSTHIVGSCVSDKKKKSGGVAQLRVGIIILIFHGRSSRIHKI